MKACPHSYEDEAGAPAPCYSCLEAELQGRAQMVVATNARIEPPEGWTVIRCGGGDD